MNKNDRKMLREAIGKLEEAKAIVEELAVGEQDKFDNMSEGLQQTEQGQNLEQAASTLDEAVGTLEGVISDLSDLP